MAFYPELKAVALDAYNKMVQVLEAKAMTALNVGKDQIIIRELRPEDVGATTPFWPAVNITAPATWTPVVSNYSIMNNRFVGINGFYNNEGAGEISQIKITRKGSAAKFWPVNAIKSWPAQTGWNDMPVTIDENTTITIEFAAAVASTVSDYEFFGAVAERRGLLVNP